MRALGIGKPCVLGAMMIAAVAGPVRAQEPARVEDPPQAQEQEKLDAESRRLAIIVRMNAMSRASGSARVDRSYLLRNSR
jgi:hypothetical protein